MDRQMEFLQVWAAACQPIVFALVDDIERFGLDVAHKNFTARAKAFMKSDAEIDKMGEQEDFAYWCVALAHMYVDLMARYGVFDAE